jgi:ABC-2 type transport system ATP-binding protein
MTTPYLDEAERCHRVALVHEGTLLALDAPGRLRTSLPGVWIEAFPPDARAVRDRMRAAGHAHVEVFGERLHVWLPATTAAAEVDRTLAAMAASAGVSPFGGRVITPALEDVFIAKLAEIAAAPPGATS